MRNLQSPPPITIPNLGHVLTRLAHHEASEELMHMDVSAFHAPGECHALVSKGEDRRFQALLTELGLTEEAIEAEARRRVSGNTLYRATSRLVSEYLDRHCPYR